MDVEKLNDLFKITHEVIGGTQVFGSLSYYLFCFIPLLSGTIFTIFSDADHSLETLSPVHGPNFGFTISDLTVCLLCLHQLRFKCQHFWPP